MSEPAYPVGYSRPPGHTRFQKGRSGNPGGRPGPKKLAKQAFDAALNQALNADEQVLREATPAKVIESFARQVVLLALDGQPSAQRLLLSILEREGLSAADDERTDEDRFVFDGDEHARQFLGDRYDEFKTRFETAVAAGSVDDLAALAEEFDCTDKFPQSGNF